MTTAAANYTFRVLDKKKYFGGCGKCGG